MTSDTGDPERVIFRMEGPPVDASVHPDGPAEGLRLLVAQMRQASAAGFYLPALITGLTLPDILGALGSENGRASGSKYRSWVDEHGPKELDGASLYAFRCSLLHQGSAQTGGEFRYAFIEPNPNAPQIHALSTDVGDGVPVAWLSVPMFIEDLATAAAIWVEKFGETNLVQRNLARFVRRRPEGLPPHVVGGPVIA